MTRLPIRNTAITEGDSTLPATLNHFTVTLEDMAFDPRRAGLVKRYHTWETLMVQSVAEHSWQVMRILLAIYPGAPRHMLVHCMTHDIGEAVAGDMPYPIKLVYPALRQVCDEAEAMTHDVMSNTWGVPARKELPAVEKSIFKLAEFMEMWEYGLHEVELGNHIAKLICTRTQPGIVKYLKEVPEDIERAAARYYQHRANEHESTMKRKAL